MGKSIKFKITEAIIHSLYDAFSNPYWLTYSRLSSENNLKKDYYRTAVGRLSRQGLLKVVDKNGQRFLQLTQKGQLKALMQNISLQDTPKWDGKWRMIIFDIPEDAKPKREELRKLLLQNDFYKLQASVFINPKPLNREAILYLRKSGLIDYIRMLRVDEVDYDADLRKRFGLQRITL